MPSKHTPEPKFRPTNYKLFECCGGGGPSELAGHRFASCYAAMQHQYQAERAAIAKG
jgi:hypothetical protein